MRRNLVKLEFKWIYSAPFTVLLCIYFWESVSLVHFAIKTSLLKVVSHARVEERGTGVQHVASGLYRGNEVNCVSGACRAGLKCAWSGQADESRGALWGERKKFSTRRGRTTLTEPLQSHFLCLEKTFPAILVHFCPATPLLRFRERNPTFLLKWKHQHHGAALPRNGHHHTSSSRSEPPVRWQSPAELVDHRGEVSTPIFLFQRRPERYSAVYEEDGRDLDVGGIPKHRVLTSLIISVLDFKASWFVSLPLCRALFAIFGQ